MIMPCCGESSRFPGLKKQFMIHPTGMPLPIFSASGIVGCREHIFVFLRKDFEDVYSSAGWFTSIAAKHGLLLPMVILLEGQTNSQVETVRKAIEIRNIRHAPVYIKDNDNYFKTQAGATNYVNVENIENGDFEIRNKSFTEFNASNIVTKIQERGLISNHINVGGYGFQSSDTFLKFSEGCNSVSGVIRNIMIAGGEFCGVPVADYQDYGTMKAWVNYLYENYV